MALRTHGGSICITEHLSRLLHKDSQNTKSGFSLSLIKCVWGVCVCVHHKFREEKDSRTLDICEASGTELGKAWSP